MQKEKTLTLLDVIKNFDSDSFIALLKSKHGFSNDESFLDFMMELENEVDKEGIKATSFLFDFAEPINKEDFLHHFAWVGFVDPNNKTKDIVKIPKNRAKQYGINLFFASIAEKFKLIPEFNNLQYLIHATEDEENENKEIYFYFVVFNTKGKFH